MSGALPPLFERLSAEADERPGNPQRLRIQLGGRLRSGSRLMPALFVIEQGNDGLEVRHERFD